MSQWRIFFKENWLTLVIVLGLAGAYILLRTPGDVFASPEAIEAQITAGQPTVIEFYSNRCSICLIAKPKVDRLEKEMQGQATLLRLNVKDPVGRKLAVKWGVRGVPSFFVFNGEGTLVYASAGSPNIEEIKNAVEQAIQ